MMVLAHPRELDKARLRSLFAEAITEPPAKESPGAEAEIDQLAARALERRRKKHPDDLGLAICEALRAMSASGASPAAPALARLVRLVEEDAARGTRSQATEPMRAQRSAAAKQIPLWLVARACWKPEGRQGSAPSSR